MNTNPSLGAGLAGVLANAVAAGIIASSRGSAIAAPAPLRNVRRGIAFLVMNTTRSFLIATRAKARDYISIDSSVAHLKRNALYDSENQRGQPIPIFLRIAKDLANGRGVVVLDAAAKPKRQKVLRYRCCNQFGTAEQRVFESVDSSELPRAGQSGRRIDGLPIRIRLAPLSYRIEILEREAHGIDHAVTARASRVTTMRRHTLAHRKIGRHIAFVERRDVGRRRWRRGAEDVLQHENSAKYGRCPRRIRGHRQHAALPQQPATMAFGCERHTAEPAAIHVGNSIVFCQPFIEEGIIRADQAEHAAILTQYAVEEELGFLPEGLPQVIIEVAINGVVRSDGIDIAQPQPLPGEIRRQVERASIGKHTARLFLELSGLGQFSPDCGIEQLIVRDAAPQKERKTRCQLEIADPVGAVRRNSLQVSFHSEQEVRIGKHRAQRSFDSGVEITFIEAAPYR